MSRNLEFGVMPMRHLEEIRKDNSLYTPETNRSFEEVDDILTEFLGIVLDEKTAMQDKERTNVLDVAGGYLSNSAKGIVNMYHDRVHVTNLDTHFLVDDAVPVERVLGDANNSRLVKTFQVKSGAESSPTPLPKFLGKEYWLLTHEEDSSDNPDTAPYFLRLNVPTTDEWPYGPVPYEECKDPITGEKTQCDWVLPGYFGLHGTGGNPSKLSKEDTGSSGCIRHSDSEITYLFKLLNPEKEDIRYYIEDI